GLYRVQRRPLRALVHAVEQGRPGKDQRKSRRRRPDPDLAQGQARPAAQDRDRVKTVISPARWAEGYGIGALSLAPKRREGWPVASTRAASRPLGAGNGPQ